MSRIRVLIADDHRLFRQGLRWICETVGGFEHIQLEPGKDLTMSISPDGTQLTCDAGQTAKASEVFMAIDPVER